jgi:hypothetical protein
MGGSRSSEVGFEVQDSGSVLRGWLGIVTTSDSSSIVR